MAHPRRTQKPPYYLPRHRPVGAAPRHRQRRQQQRRRPDRWHPRHRSVAGTAQHRHWPAEPQARHRRPGAARRQQTLTALDQAQTLDHDQPLNQDQPLDQDQTVDLAQAIDVAQTVDLAQTIRLPIVPAPEDDDRPTVVLPQYRHEAPSLPVARRVGFLASSRSAGPLCYGLTQAVLLFWWVAFYPGTLSYDSVMAVWQVGTNSWAAPHSVVYNVLVWLSLQATGQLWALTLAQTVAMAGGLAYAATGLMRLRVSRRLASTAAVAAVGLPVLGTFTVHVSKDVPFMIAQVWLLGTLARMLASGPHPHRRLWATVFVELVLIGLFRHSGFVVIALAVGGLAAVLAHIRSGLLTCAAAAAAVGMGANLVYPALGVRPVGPEIVLGPVFSDIAVAYAHRPDVFTPAEVTLLGALVLPSLPSLPSPPAADRQATSPLGGTAAHCGHEGVTSAYARRAVTRAIARGHRAELMALWLSLVRRVPDEIVQARLCRGSIAWNPFPEPAAGQTVKIPISGADTLFGFPADQWADSPFPDAIRSAPPSDLAHGAGRWLRHVSDTPAFEWLAWRGATWSYLAYLVVLLFVRRTGDRSTLGFAALVAANQLNVLVNSTDQLVRTMVAPIVLGVMLLPLAFTPAPGHRTGGS